MAPFISRKLLEYNKLKYWCYQCYLKDRNIFHVRFKKYSPPTESREIVTLSNGKKITLSTGLYARIADASATVLFGDTAVMVAAVTGEAKDPGLLLNVNYKQKAAAAGRIPTSFFRKEITLTDTEVIASRVVDRSLRPLFPQGYSKHVQITCNMLAADGINDPDILAINGASTALSLSSIPWNGPIGAVRVGVIDQEVLINPTRRELQKSALNLIIAATKQQQIVMLEGSADNIRLPDFKKALRKGVKECQSIINGIVALQKKCGKTKENFLDTTNEFSDIIEHVRNLSAEKLQDIFTDYTHHKTSRDNAVKSVQTAVINNLQKEFPNLNIEMATNAFSKVCKDVLRQLIFEDKRCDGRKLDDLRDITCKTNLYQTLHGSSLFQRGQTQVLCTVTLDAPENSLKMDTASMLISGVKEKNFFLHYEFPSYATNDIRTTTNTRRETGHGMLAEKGLRPVIPDNHPFTTRLNCEVLESNGKIMALERSSSMASICAGSLALLDAGVPISQPVSGIAMGLVTKCNDQNFIEDYKILTDIMGIEDYFGDMDFKVAGTNKGFTAVQVDIKIMGLPIKIVSEVMEKFLTANAKILSLMHATIPSPRTQGKENTMPVIENIKVPAHQRGKFIGIGGMNLKKILIETGVNINLRDEDTFSVFAPNQAAMNEAKEIIEEILTKEREVPLEFGEIYTATIVEIRENGVMVTLYPNMIPTLLHTNQLDQRKVTHPSVLGLVVGQEIQVKYFGRDPSSGHMRLSRKVLQDLNVGIKSYKTSVD